MQLLPIFFAASFATMHPDRSENNPCALFYQLIAYFKSNALACACYNCCFSLEVHSRDEIGN